VGTKVKVLVLEYQTERASTADAIALTATPAIGLELAMVSRTDPRNSSSMQQSLQLRAWDTASTNYRIIYHLCNNTFRTTALLLVVRAIGAEAILQDVDSSQ
jgi:hypothetical protein